MEDDDKELISKLEKETEQLKSINKNLNWLFVIPLLMFILPKNIVWDVSIGLGIVFLIYIFYKGLNLNIKVMNKLSKWSDED